MHHIYKKYEEAYVLQNVSFGLQQGEILGVIGPNGAGKSTLINVLTNINKSTFGKTEIKCDDELHIGICP